MKSSDHLWGRSTSGRRDTGGTEGNSANQQWLKRNPTLRGHDGRVRSVGVDKKGISE